MNVRTSDATTTSASRIRVTGQVQGVGFRPFVYRLAREWGLAGSVRNTSAGVWIEIEGPADRVARFAEELPRLAPPAACIDTLEAEAVEPVGRSGFLIADSTADAPPEVRVPRDLAVCPECVTDVTTPSDRRHGYPFTTCTNCGPRYSLMTALPYDRPFTAMHHFPLCARCAAEYADPDDRRFHAQPIACPECGPRLALWDDRGRTLAGPTDAIPAAVAHLHAGRIVVVKGLGGFQLLVRADRSEPVARLRQRKGRPGKPFAVMVSSPAEAERLAEMSDAERRLLTAPHNPIVLLRPRGAGLAPEVAPRIHTVGLFLPTTPLHHLLLHAVGLPLIATSGNRSEEPIARDEHEALRDLAGIADMFLVHDRPVVCRLDDSVERVIAGRPVSVRLARGRAPWPLPSLEVLAGSGSPALVAVGGHQKVALAVSTGRQVVLTQHLGDMDGPAARTAFAEAVEHLGRMYHFRPSALVCDAHPDYFTTRWAQAQGLPVETVQHHHAHAVAAMAEFGLLDREVLALSWDGTGFGTDGTVWGGEILRATATDFERVAHLRPFPLPGGEAAVREPARVAFALLGELFGFDAVLREPTWMTRLGLEPAVAAPLAALVARRVRTPLTSSMGRLFDAVAALVLGANRVSYEGEAAAWLEAVADPRDTTAYPLSRGDWEPLLRALLDDLRRDVSVATIAARFHNALARWAAEAVAALPQTDVVLGGGCFQNRLLTERVHDALLAAGKHPHGPGLIPPGDGGLSAGQLAVALARRAASTGGRGHVSRSSR